jgi:hypothetical protein
MSKIICQSGCTAENPDFEFDNCNPEIVAGGSFRLYMFNDGQSFPDPTIMGSAAALAAYSARASNTSNNADAIRFLTINGDLPIATKNELKISDNRTRTVNKDYVFNFEIDELNDTNRLAIQQLQCGWTGRIVFENDTLLWGGIDEFSEGVLASLDIDLEIPRDNKDITRYKGTLKWTNRHLMHSVENFIR